MWKPLCSYWAPFLPGVPRQAGCGRDDTGWASVWATGLWGASGVSSSGGLTMAGNPPAGSSWARWSGGISLTTIPAAPSAGWASIRLWRPMHNTALPDKCLCCTTVHNTRRNTLWLFHNLFILFPSLLDGGSSQFPNRRKATVFCLGAHLFSYQNNGFFIFPLGSIQSCCLSSSPACSCSVLPPAPQIRYRPPARSKGGFPPSSRRDPPPCPPLWCWQSGC